jgi:L,D-peptidoglycan transpeptidase YkuD (ErfK/YbiS/YcfS/YnhG family)
VRLRLFLLSLVLLFASAAADAGDLAWSDARQLVLVVTQDWDANQGTLAAFEHRGDGWRAVRKPVPVAIGRSGSAWGIGLHAAQGGPQKQEGDGRSPAGVFRIGEAFGYAPTLATALHYAGMQESDYCVDVSGSPYYNRIVDAQKVGADAVKGSTEPMRRDLHANGDVRYKLGFVIEHNPDGRPQGGSCIFAHLWRSTGEPTSGCTAMTEPVMRELLAWLRDDQHPVFVLLPRAEYARLKASWGLPELTMENH